MLIYTPWNAFDVWLLYSIYIYIYIYYIYTYIYIYICIYITMVMVHYRDRPVLNKLSTKCWGKAHT